MLEILYFYAECSNLQIKVGPDSVGFQLQVKGLVFGGTTLTASDVAVASGVADMGDPDCLKKHQLSETLTTRAMDVIHNMVEDVVDQVKVCAGLINK